MIKWADLGAPAIVGGIDIVSQEFPSSKVAYWRSLIVAILAVVGYGVGYAKHNDFAKNLGIAAAPSLYKDILFALGVGRPKE